MLDYYGSIKIPKKRIYSEMISYFKDYKKDYINSKLIDFYKNTPEKFLTFFNRNINKKFIDFLKK